MGIEYDGHGFAGWQWQTGKRTVQAVLEEAISRVANAPVRVIAAGRTDAGVHATGQVIHFDTMTHRTPYSWLMGSNTFLPEDVRVTWIQEVGSEFHARYSAIARYYRYVILNRSMRSALAPHQLTWVYLPLDADLMQLGANFLIGEHDFSSFRAQGCQSKSPNRQMHFIKVSREADRIHIDLCANAFVHHMVRNIAGALIDVGSGKRKPEWIREVLEAKSRACGGVTAPPDGLYFAGVCYPEDMGLVRHDIFKDLPANARRHTPSETP
jgi:tRNA pseudouridine38-40 synthase